MSLNALDRVSASGAAASDSATGEARAPVLRSGALYAGFKANMHVYLQKHDAQNVHTTPLTEEEYRLDEEEVAAWNMQALSTARAALRARRAEKKENEFAAAGDGKVEPSAASAVHAVVSAEEKAERAVLAAHVARSQKAYGTIFNALPEDMRLLVRHIAQGWAYGLWMWLERKFQSTEADNVSNLIGAWTSLENPVEESFDAWRARVNELNTLLKHAKEPPSARMYAHMMLKKLHPRFRPAVLALENGVLLKDPENIDWEAVSALLNAHDREERQMAAAADATAMAAHTKSYYGLTPGGENKAPTSTGAKYPASQERRGSGSSNNGRDREHHPRKETRTCFKCEKVGHIARFCKQSKKSGAGGRDEQASSAIASNAKHSREEFGYAVMIKPAAGAKAKIPNKNSKGSGVEKKKIETSNQYQALQGVDDEADVAEEPLSKRKRKRRVRFDLRKKLLGVNQKKLDAKKKAGPAGSAKAMAATTAPKHEFGIDSMASVNLSGNKAIFIKGSLKKCKAFRVTVADNSVVEVTQVGSVELHIDVAPGQTATFIIDRVHYHPRFGANLLSVDSLKKSGWEFHCSEAETYLLTPQHKLKVRLSTERRLSILSCSSTASGEEATGKVFSVVALEWDKAADLVHLHERLGHMGFDKMVRVIKADRTEGIGKLNMSAAVIQEARKRVLECRACTQGKGTRTAFGHRGLDRGSAPGESIHMDTYYVKYQRADESWCVEYGLTMSCPYTSFRWTARLLSKDEGAQQVINIIKMAQTQFQCAVKRLHADGGTEFINHTLKSFCSKEGIELHYPPAGTPQLNSIAERSVRSGKDAARTLLMHCGLPPRFGWRAVHHANYLWNRTNVAAATGVTPYEAMVKKKPSLESLGVFGCDVFYHVPKADRGVLDAKMLPGIYLGHKHERDGAVVHDLRTGTEIITRDVKFHHLRFTHAAALRAGGAQLEQVLSGASYLRDDAPPDSPERDAPPALLGDVFGNPAAEQDEVHDVERIVGRRVRDGRTEYQVKWMNYDKTTWEPADNVELGAEEAIEEFLAAQSPAPPG